MFYKITWEVKEFETKIEENNVNEITGVKM
jgi:hypothetical protein